MRKLFLSFFCLFLTLSVVAQSPPFEATMLPALYKTPSGLIQKVRLTVRHKGAPTSAEISFDGRKQTLQLKEGDNYAFFDFPQVTAASQKTATYKDQRLTVEVKPIRHWSMNFVMHTHTDIGYTRSQTEILAEQLRFIDTALDYCDATDQLADNAKFRWTCETSWAVSEYLKARPASQIERLKRRVKEGRIELAAMYLNFDELPDEQSLAASLYPLKQFRRAGMKAEVAMQNDVNGIGWCFTEFFADAGVKYLNMGTHGHRALISFDKPTLFWWESPSGKKIMTHRAEHYMYGNFMGIEKPDFEVFENKVLDYMNSMAAQNYPLDLLSIQHSGYFTDNSPPSTRSSDFVTRWNEKYEWPKLRVAVASDFFKSIEAAGADKLPTIRGAWPDWWTDGFGSGAREAAVSRITHSYLISTQTGFSLAKLMGARMPLNAQEQMDEINKALLFYDEHTFGFHNSVRDPYGTETWEQRSLKMSYAWEAYRRGGLAGEYANGLLQDFIPKTDVPSIAVFNPLNWAFTGVVKAYIDHQILPSGKEFEIVDPAGNICPAQSGRHYSDGTLWSIAVKEVPPLGYTQLYIRIKGDKPDAQSGASKLKTGSHGNQWYGLVFDPAKGVIKQIVDKDTKQNLLSEQSEYAFGQFIYELIDSRRPMEKYTRPQFLRRSPESMKLVATERGPIWDTYRFTGNTPAGRDADNLQVEFRLYNTEKKIELVYFLRKQAVTDPEAVYIAFPFDVKNGKLYLDVPGGNIEAGVDQIPNSSHDWYTVQNFAAARNDASQVVVVSPEIPLMQMGAINTGRYSEGHLPQSTQMFSWPMNNYWVTNFNADQMGGTEFSYLITSDKDNTDRFATRFAWSNRIPMLTRVLPPSAKAAKPLQPVSVLKGIPENLLIVSMTPVEGENALLLHLREIGGQSTSFTASSDFVRLKKPSVCNVLGEPLTSGSLTFKPWEIKFIKLMW